MEYFYVYYENQLIFIGVISNVNFYFYLFEDMQWNVNFMIKKLIKSKFFQLENIIPVSQKWAESNSAKEGLWNFNLFIGKKKSLGG